MAMLHIMAAITVYFSSWPICVKAIAIMTLILVIVYVQFHPYPTKNYQALIYKKRHEPFLAETKEALIFNKHRILLDLGLFFIAEFYQEEKKRIIVIFHDQIKPDEYRKLKIIERCKLQI